MCVNVCALLEVLLGSSSESTRIISGASKNGLCNLSEVPSTCPHIVIQKHVDARFSKYRSGAFGCTVSPTRFADVELLDCGPCATLLNDSDPLKSSFPSRHLHTPSETANTGSTEKNDERKQERANERANVRANDRKKERTNARRDGWTDGRTNGTAARPSERTKERANERKSERTNQRTHERTSQPTQPTNQPTNTPTIKPTNPS